MRRRPALLATPVLVLLLAESLRAAAPVVPADRFLLDWIDDNAAFEMFARFHSEFPRSPHKRDREELEVAWRCLRSRTELGEERAASLVDGLVGRVADPADAGRGRRIVFVLGRLQDPRALPALIRAAKAGDDDIRSEAIEALGLFGNRRYEDLKCVFGGRLWMVVFPPCPDRRATETLREVLEEPEPRWVPEPRALTFEEHLRRREPLTTGRRPGSTGAGGRSGRSRPTTSRR